MVDVISQRAHAKVIECLSCGSLRLMGRLRSGERFGEECRRCGDVGWVLAPDARVINAEIALLRELFPGPVQW